MKLYYSPNACSLASHIVLRESGLKFDLEKVDLKTKKTSTGEDYLKINPKGYVPTLRLDNNEILTEGPAIMHYIADSASSANLIPSDDPMSRYRVLEWLNFISSEIHKVLGAFFNPKLPEETKKILTEKFKSRADYLDQYLLDYDYLMGKTFSIADAYLFTVLRWAPFINFNLQQWPTLSKYVEKIQARTSVKEALAFENP